MIRLLLLVPILLAADTSPRSAGTDFFPMREGLTWVFEQGERTQTMKIVERVKLDGRNCWLMEITYSYMDITYRQWFEKDRRGVRVLKLKYADEISELHEPLPQLRLPAGKAQKWDWSGTIWQMKYHIEGTHQGFEKVKVQGKFVKCLKVHRKYAYAGTGMDLTYWYAPRIGPVKISTQASGGEATILTLKEFRSK